MSPRSSINIIHVVCAAVDARLHDHLTRAYRLCVCGTDRIVPIFFLLSAYGPGLAMYPFSNLARNRPSTSDFEKLSIENYANKIFHHRYRPLPDPLSRSAELLRTN
uniref:Uncharacterized protein n=1 Tax=Anopheles minimus TaxID=112268 RepID=A0A182WP09_9DIPT